VLGWGGRDFVRRIPVRLLSYGIYIQRDDKALKEV
jgi:hypothetical protein